MWVSGLIITLKTHHDAGTQMRTATKQLTCTLGEMATVIMPYMVKNVSVMKVKAQ